MAYIEARNLSIGYDKTPVSKNIDFALERGDYLFILGENGAGKSTLMKTILGLISPLSGEVYFDETVKCKIGYLPQQTEAQKDFPASVEEVVLSGTIPHMGHRFFYGKKEKSTAEVNIRRLGIENLRKRCFRELSGGQKQRVLLARALCAADKLLLLDEPVSGLDPVATEEMYKLVEKLHSEGTTVIMISHDLEAAYKYADKVLHLSDSDVFFGSREEYLKNSDGFKDLMEGKND
ncbi:MAG: metal ABC transporter ATP-binding protein [Lachnospiraceae bacterium]|nr:metal ABC transporter ATP-binding protein [Lachnospiraceae bacterium]